MARRKKKLWRDLSVSWSDNDSSVYSLAGDSWTEQRREPTVGASKAEPMSFFGFTLFETEETLQVNRSMESESVSTSDDDSTTASTQAGGNFFDRLWEQADAPKDEDDEKPAPQRKLRIFCGAPSTTSSNREEKRTSVRNESSNDVDFSSASTLHGRSYSRHFWQEADDKKDRGDEESVLQRFSRGASSVTDSKLNDDEASNMTSGTYLYKNLFGTPYTPRVSLPSSEIESGIKTKASKSKLGYSNLRDDDDTLLSSGHYLYVNQIGAPLSDPQVEIAKQPNGKRGLHSIQEKQEKPKSDRTVQDVGLEGGAELEKKKCFAVPWKKNLNSSISADEIRERTGFYVAPRAMFQPKLAGRIRATDRRDDREAVQKGPFEDQEMVYDESGRKPSKCFLYTPRQEGDEALPASHRIWFDRKSFATNGKLEDDELLNKSLSKRCFLSIPSRRKADPPADMTFSTVKAKERPPTRQVAQNCSTRSSNSSRDNEGNKSKQLHGVLASYQPDFTAPRLGDTLPKNQPRTNSPRRASKHTRRDPYIDDETITSGWFTLESLDAF